MDIRLLLLEPIKGRRTPSRTAGDALIVSACRRFRNKFPVTTVFVEPSSLTWTIESGSQQYDIDLK